MASFGLDSKFVNDFLKELNVEFVRFDQVTDFFLLPQLDAIYKYCGEELKSSVAKKMKDCQYSPKPPIEMEIPKNSRVRTKSTAIVGPNYFRPGAVLFPEDRVVYHYFSQKCSSISEIHLDRKKVFSHHPLKIDGKGFAPAAQQWKKLKTAFGKEIKKPSYNLVLRCDITQYFPSINQHEMVNQLEHQGLPSELVKFAEKFLASLTVDRSSRGIIQGCFASDVLGNGYLTAIDEYIAEEGYQHFRYVDDMYVFFDSADDFRSFFPEFVKRLRDYDLSLNESKTFVSTPLKLLIEETELDKALKAAKDEAVEKLKIVEEHTHFLGTDNYGDDVLYTELLEIPPDDDEVELQATREIFEKLADFQGEERNRAESFCLSFFRRSGDPIAIDKVVAKWARSPERAREYALYLSKFLSTKDHSKKIEKMVLESSDTMIEYQWSWATYLLRRMPKIWSSELLNSVVAKQKDGANPEVIRSLLTYVVCKHGTAQRKKAIRDNYQNSSLLVKLATIHCARYFTSGERSALMKSVDGHGDIEGLMCLALKRELAEKNK